MSPREETSNGSAVAAQPSQSEDATRQLKNRPKATALRQQQLPAWQPILTASTVIPTVFGVGVIFIPIGIALFLASDGVVEHSVTYEGESDTGGCGAIGTACTIHVDVKQMDGDVYFYYQLDNYYQNHRRYVKSRNDMQYLGNLDSISECEPYAKNGDQYIVPCGAIANSMFNDTFKLLDPVTMVPVPFTEEGVLWDVDTQRKFKNPATYVPGMDVNACKNGPFKNTASPPNWGSKHICDLPNALQNTDLIVWMRTAALPSFRKLYRKLDRSHAKYANGLPAGRYQLVIQNNYPVASFDGVKRFVMSTTSWAGGKNSFLGIAYLVVGCLAFLLGVVFVVIHYKFGHSLSELGNVPEPHS